MSDQSIEPIYIVCYATAKTGLGHLMRCMSLARQLIQLDEAVLLTGNFSPFACQLMAYFNLPYRLISSPIDVLLLSLPSHAKVVIDSYDLKEKNLVDQYVYVLIDDYCRFDHYPVAGVINFTIHADQYDYVAKGAKSQALGLRFFLAQPSLKRQTEKCYDAAYPEKLLLLIGSGDPLGLEQQILMSLAQINHSFVIRVLTNNRLPQYSSFQHHVECFALEADINQHYQWADFCITSGGLSKYECAFLGNPAAVISLTAEEHQETQDFTKAGLCFDLGLGSSFDGAAFANALDRIFQESSLRQMMMMQCRQRFSSSDVFATSCYVLNCFQSVDV